MEDTTGAALDDQAETVTDPAEQQDTGQMFQAAARGDATAQAAMAFNARQVGLDGLAPIGEALAVAELYARMAAASGQADHIMTLATILGSRYDLVGNVALDPDELAPLTEYCICLRIAAAAGHEIAAQSLKTITDIATVAPVVEAHWAEILTSLSDGDVEKTEAAPAEQA